MHEFSYIVFKFLDIIFVISVNFEILSHYLNIDSSQTLRDEVQWIIDNVFREKLMVQMAPTLCSRTFLLSFWILPVFVAVFLVNDLL